MYLCIHVWMCLSLCQVKVKESEESIGGHESFHVSLLNVEKWLMIMRQKLESYRSSTGEWSLDNRQQEAEVLTFHIYLLCSCIVWYVMSRIVC